MLYFLIIISTILIFTLPVSAEIKFFNDKVDFFNQKINSGKEDNECLNCTPDVTPPEMKPQISPINKNLLFDNPVMKNVSIRLFIDTQCRFSSASLKYIKQLKQRNHLWDFDVFIMGSFNSFNNFALDNKDILKSDIELSWDIQNNESSKYNVSKCPAYVIEYKNKVYKISGQPDIEEIVRKL